MSFRQLRQKIIEKRRMKDVKLETDYIQIGDLFGLLDLQEKQLGEIRDSVQKDFEYYNEEIKKNYVSMEDDDCGLRIARASKFSIIQFINNHLLGVDSDKKESMK